MRVLRIHAYCDACQARGVETEIDPERLLTLALREGEARKTLDLCPQDEAELLDPLRELIGETPRPAVSEPEAEPEGKRAEEAEPSLFDQLGPDDPMQCPLCTSKPIRRNLLRHLTTMHGVERTPQPEACPGCTYTTANSAAMITHRVRVHGYNELDVILEGLMTDGR